MRRFVDESNELSVGDIIERVLIRGNEEPYRYNRKATQQLTSQQHLWHYRLQQQNLELKQKVRNLTLKYKKKIDYHTRDANLQKQIQSLRMQLDGIIKSNAHLQEEINQMRLKNSSINNSIRNSLDESIKKRKHNRSCSCSSFKKLPEKARHRRKASKINLNECSLPPQKQILKTTKDVSVICLMAWKKDDQVQKVQQKKDHIKVLKKIAQNQEKLIASYVRQIKQKRENHQLSKNKTIESTQRGVYPIERTVSQNIFKPPSSAGSIVKIKRH